MKTQTPSVSSTFHVSGHILSMNIVSAFTVCLVVHSVLLADSQRL